MEESRIQGWPGLIKQAVVEFIEDDASTLGAAFAFYTILSLAPTIIILIWIGTLLSSHAQETVLNQAVNLAGSEAASVIRNIIDHSQKHPVVGSVSGLLSFAMLVVGALGSFGRLQTSVNRIWGLATLPHRGLRLWLRRTVLSLVMIVVVGVLLPVSVGITAGLSWIFGKWIVINVGVSLFLFSFLFALIFKYMPDARISWKDAALGAIVTGVLFEGGKFGIAVYLGRNSAVSAYGAAGSLILLLLWIYYSAVIFFFGAEVTQVWAKSSGRTIRPSGNAVQMDCKPVIRAVRAPGRGSARRGKKTAGAAKSSARR